MKAWQVHQFGLDGLRFVEVPTPAPGEGEVLIELAAQSINYRDLMMIEGRYNPRQPLPLIPGSDGAGEVVSVGSAVDASMVGTRVMGLFAPHWQSGPPVRSVVRHSLGGPMPGTLAEAIVLPADGVIAVPEVLSNAEAATLPCAGLTAWSAVAELGGVEAGDKVLVEGTGGVAIFALQFATLLGADVMISSSSNDKLERARQLGAAVGVNYRDNPDWGTAAREWAGDGVDLVVDVGGGETLPEALKAVKMGGTIAVIGVLSGAESRLSVVPILMNQVRVQGVIVGSRAAAERMLSAIAEGGMQPVVDTTFALDDLPRALEHLKAGKHFGKIAIAS